MKINKYPTIKKRRSPYEMRITNLRKARIEQGLIIEDVARLTGYSFSTIVKAEQGRVNNKRPNDSRTQLFWKTMSDFYGKPEEELIG